jgi:Ca2+-binding EF-hand superfamily protein
MVAKAFAMMDRDGCGTITIKDIVGIYDVSLNPEFLESRKTKDEILRDFLSNFEGARGDRDGVITKQEFFDYYTDLSACTPSDEYFVRMMESTWQCPEDDSSAATQQTVGHLLREVKSRVFQLARQDPSLLKKIFSDFDLN